MGVLLLLPLVRSWLPWSWKGYLFSPGLKLQSEIWKKFKLLVSVSSSELDPFFLVVAFGHCKFHLSVRSVSLILQASIGGNTSLFKVLHLSDRVFRFSVFSKPVRLFIFNLLSFECDLFKLSFHLWGNGGPNWHQEFKLFSAEEERSSTKVLLKFLLTQI